MKKSVFFLIFAMIAFSAGVVGARFIQKKGKEVGLGQNSSFVPARFALFNHPFTICVIGKNNGAFVEKTLRSIYSQNYESFRVVYIDDGSDDGSFDLAKEWINELDDGGRTLVVQNEETLGALANIDRTVEGCEKGEIVLLLHGEDQLAHEWVLQRLNCYYQDPDLWFALASWIDYPSYQFGIGFEGGEDFRTRPITGHYLKTFHADLFKKINKSDLMVGGKYLEAAADFAYLTPMFEMAHEHFHFIPEVLYVHNQNGIHQENRTKQLQCEKRVRSLSPYKSIDLLEEGRCFE